jgi:hypothetical protein
MKYGLGVFKEGTIINDDFQEDMSITHPNEWM